MYSFKSPKLEDFKKFAPFFFDEGELSCEMNFINIYIWQQVYGNKFYLDDKVLILKSQGKEGEVFSLPFGDFDHGMSVIFDYCKQNGIKPNLWTNQGKRMETFLKKFTCYDAIPQRDSFDYIYNREDLAELKGKKYHSKRNHISAFSRKYNWTYHSLNKDNICEFLSFADRWYDSREQDNGLKAEKNALHEILAFGDTLNIQGALIKVENRVVAATFGSPINSYTFDIHFEKADIQFPTAYTVINREFAARQLSEYKYINREDDLGIEGLRKAKLSYKPEIILEKYNMIYKGDEF